MFAGVFAAMGMVMLAVTLALFAVKAFAFVDALTRPAETFDAAGKWSKPGWAIVLGLFLALHMVRWSPVDLFNIVGTIAAFVYVLDVRPAVSQFSRRR